MKTCHTEYYKSENSYHNDADNGAFFSQTAISEIKIFFLLFLFVIEFVKEEILVFCVHNYISHPELESEIKERIISFADKVSDTENKENHVKYAFESLVGSCFFTA